MGRFERLLSLWVVLCMVVGVGLGRTFPNAIAALRALEFGSGSQINVPIAVLIWLMIYPMMLRIDLASVLGVRRRPRGILVTLFVNWLVKPFSMALLGWLFFKHLFQPWIGDALADQYIAGVIILAAAPCTAMVFVWSYLTDGDPAYTLVQVSLNDLLMLLLFAPIVTLLVTGASNLTVPFEVLLYSVLVFIVVPLALGSASRAVLLRRKGADWFENALPATLSARRGSRTAGDAGPHLRVPGGQPDQPSSARRPDRDPDPGPGLLQLGSRLRSDAARCACPTASPRPAR